MTAWLAVVLVVVVVAGLVAMATRRRRRSFPSPWPQVSDNPQPAAVTDLVVQMGAHQPRQAFPWLLAPPAGTMAATPGDSASDGDPPQHAMQPAESSGGDPGEEVVVTGFSEQAAQPRGAACSTQEESPEHEAPVDGLLTCLGSQRQIAATDGTIGTPVPAEGEKELVTVAADPLVKAEVVVDEAVRQVLEERTTTLPLPAIKVREITTRVVDVRCHLLVDKVIVQAVVEKQIFFVGEDDLVHHVSERIPVSTFLDVPGTQPDMICQTRVTVERVLHELVTPTTVHQKVLLRVFAKVTRLEHLNLIVEPGGLRTKVVRVIADVLGQLVQEIPVTLTVPAIKVAEVRVSVPAESLSIEPIQDKVIIQGIIHKQIFFVDENNVERHQVVDAPFSLFVEAPGTLPGDVVTVRPRILFESAELLIPEGATSSTELLEKVVIEFAVDVGRLDILDLRLDPAGTLIKADVVLGQGEVQLLIERDVTLALPALKISDVLLRVENVRAVSLPGKVLVQGVVHKQLFFVGLDDGLEHHQAELIPFTGVVDILGSEPDLLVQVTPTIEHTQNELVSPTQVHQKIILRLAVAVSELRQVRLATQPYPYPA